jgi:hypothetical protein
MPIYAADEAAISDKPDAQRTSCVICGRSSPRCVTQVSHVIELEAS